MYNDITAGCAAHWGTGMFGGCILAGDKELRTSRRRCKRSRGEPTTEDGTRQGMRTGVREPDEDDQNRDTAMEGGKDMEERGGRSRCGFFEIRPRKDEEFLLHVGL